MPHKTRRRSIPGGSVAASMLLTVLSGTSPHLPATVLWISAQLFRFYFSEITAGMFEMNCESTSKRQRWTDPSAFDHYGTLFNKQAIAELIEQEFPGHGAALACLWFATIQRHCFMNDLMERYQSWGEMTQEALTFGTRSLGLSVGDDFHARLIAADLQLTPYPEAPEALARLASKRKLYVLSMASVNMLETTQKNANTLQYFTKIISCQSSGRVFSFLAPCWRGTSPPRCWTL